MSVQAVHLPCRSVYNEAMPLLLGYIHIFQASSTPHQVVRSYSAFPFSPRQTRPCFTPFTFIRAHLQPSITKIIRHQDQSTVCYSKAPSFHNTSAGLCFLRTEGRRLIPTPRCSQPGFTEPLVRSSRRFRFGITTRTGTTHLKARSGPPCSLPSFPKAPLPPTRQIRSTQQALFDPPLFVV